MIRIRRAGGPDGCPQRLVDLIDEMELRLIGVKCDKPGSYWWIAWDGKTPAGYCGIKPWPRYNCYFMCSAGVNPDYRRQGLHKRLIRVRERQARADGCERIVTYTSRDNVASANNLIRMGYVLYRPRADWALPGAYYFQKRL